MMAKEVFVNEPVKMLVRMLPSGSVAPTSFVWRDRSRYVADVGRQWEERVEGRSLRCYLVHAVDSNTFELRWDPTGDRWTIHRAWLRAAV